MIEFLQRIVAWLMSRVRVNQIQRTSRDGLSVFLKRRRFGGSMVIWFGNRFLSLARSGICMFVRGPQIDQRLQSLREIIQQVAATGRMPHTVKQ